MAQPQLLQASYSRGTVRDVARHVLPPNAVWLGRDLIPDLDGAPLRKRGGWSYGSPALTGASSVVAVAYAPFPAGAQLIAIGGNGHLFKVTSPAAMVDQGAGGNETLISPPVFFNDQLIIPSGTVGNTLKKYTGVGAPANLGGTSPDGALYLLSYKQRLVAANSGLLAQTHRLWFSDVLDATTFDTTNAWVPVSEPVRGLAALRNAMIVFGDNACERIRGDIPPPGGDMVREPLFEQGCLDARSIVVDGDRIVWANADGVFITDGAGIDDLAKLGGMRGYWRDLLAGYATDWTIAAGTFAGYYALTITNASGFVDGFLIDSRTKEWLPMANVGASMFASRHAGVPETYFGLRAVARVGALASILTPNSTNQSDANGTVVQPALETIDFRGKPGSKRWRNLRVGLNLDAPAGTYIKTSYVTSPEDQTYTVVTEDDGVTPVKINPTSGFQKVKVPLGVASDGLGFKLELVGPANDLQLFDLEADVHEREASR